MLDEYFTDYGPFQRFVLDISEGSYFITAQKAKLRIPHEDQIVLGSE